MTEKIFTFWEGPMPDYIKLCMETWFGIEYVMLTYENIARYTDLDLDQLKSFTLPQQSDAIRAHVLRDNGGWWLDADTILLSGKLPEENVIGDPETRTHSTGVCHYADSAKDFFHEWSRYQDKVLADPAHGTHWSIMVNDFTDDYIKLHEEVSIYPIRNCRPELDFIDDYYSSCEKYVSFYFNSNFHLGNVGNRDLLVLHNSWTPYWFSDAPVDRVLRGNCTLSNILREVGCGK